MRFYETVFIARQDLSTQQVEGLADTYIKLIKEDGGTVHDQEYWGLRTFAYPIKKNTRGHYFFFKIEASLKTMDELQRQMRLNQNVVRQLVVSVDALEKGPSVIMRTAKEKDAHEHRN